MDLKGKTKHLSPVIHPFKCCLPMFGRPFMRSFFVDGCKLGVPRSFVDFYSGIVWIIIIYYILSFSYGSWNGAFNGNLYNQFGFPNWDPGSSQLYTCFIFFSVWPAAFSTGEQHAAGWRVGRVSRRRTASWSAEALRELNLRKYHFYHLVDFWRSFQSGSQKRVIGRVNRVP